jgi:hypothetical protein
MPKMPKIDEGDRLGTSFSILGILVNLGILAHFRQ